MTDRERTCIDDRAHRTAIEHTLLIGLEADGLLRGLEECTIATFLVPLSEKKIVAIHNDPLTRDRESRFAPESPLPECKKSTAERDDYPKHEERNIPSCKSESCSTDSHKNDSGDDSLQKPAKYSPKQCANRSSAPIEDALVCVEERNEHEFILLLFLNSLLH